MVVLEGSDDSDANVRELHVLTRPMAISRHVWLYTCNNYQIKSYIGRDLVDTMELKFDKVLSENVLKLSFEYAISCVSLFKKIKVLLLADNVSNKKEC